MTKLPISVNQPVLARDAVTSTVVMRLITSCIEPGMKSTLSVDNMLIMKISIPNGSKLSRLGGLREFLSENDDYYLCIRF